MSNALGHGVHNPFAKLHVFDCTDQCSVGGKKDAQYIAGLFLSLVEKFKNTEDDYISTLTNGIHALLS